MEASIATDIDEQITVEISEITFSRYWAFMFKMMSASPHHVKPNNARLRHVLAQ